MSSISRQKMLYLHFQLHAKGQLVAFSKSGSRCCLACSHCRSECGRQQTLLNHALAQATRLPEIVCRQYQKRQLSTYPYATVYQIVGDRDEGFEPRITGVKIKRVPQFYQKWNLSNLLLDVAGNEVARWNILTDRMWLIVQRLAEQGYVYDKAFQAIHNLNEFTNTG